MDRASSTPGVAFFASPGVERTIDPGPPSTVHRLRSIVHHQDNYSLNMEPI
jgi:hypothetical protein